LYSYLDFCLFFKMHFPFKMYCISPTLIRPLLPKVTSLIRPDFRFTKIVKYNQTCIKRSPFRQKSSGLIGQAISKKRFNLYEIFYDRIRNRWIFNTGDCLIEVTTWEGLTVLLYCPPQERPLLLYGHFSFQKGVTVFKT